MQVTRRAFLAGAGTIAATAFVPGRLVEALEAELGCSVQIEVVIDTPIMA